MLVSSHNEVNDKIVSRSTAFVCLFTIPSGSLKFYDFHPFILFCSKHTSLHHNDIMSLDDRNPDSHVSREKHTQSS